MWPLGCAGAHLSSGRRCLAVGPPLGTASCWPGCRPPPPHAVLLQPASLAGLPSLCEAYGFTFLLFTGKRDGGGINCFYLGLPERLDARRKVQK